MWKISYSKYWLQNYIEKWAGWGELIRCVRKSRIFSARLFPRSIFDLSRDYFPFQTIYLPCMWVMLQEKYLRESCYKLMLLLGIWDMLNMPFSGLLTGYFAIVGDVYCSRPTVIYISGMISVGGTLIFYCIPKSCIPLLIYKKNKIQFNLLSFLR